MASDLTFWSDYGGFAIDFGRLKKIVVYQGKHLGDALLTTPLIETLRDLTPAKIIVCSTADARLLVDDPERNIFWNERHRGVVGAVRQALKITDRPVDLFIDLHGSVDSLMTKNVVAPKYSIRIGEIKKRIFDGYTVTLPRNAGIGRHKIDQHLDLLRRMGVRLDSLHRDLSTITLDKHITRDDVSRLERLVEATRDYVVIHPCSRWLFKTPSPDFWVDLMRELDRSGVRLILTGVNSSLEGQFLEYLSDATGVKNLSGKLSIADLSWVLKNSAGYVGVDTFASHLAHAHKKPGVVLFGPSDEVSWGPTNGPLEVIVNDSYKCRPCNLDGCAGSKRSECLESLDVSVVASQIMRVLGLH